MKYTLPSYAHFGPLTSVVFSQLFNYATIVSIFAEALWSSCFYYENPNLTCFSPPGLSSAGEITLDILHVLPKTSRPQCESSILACRLQPLPIEAPSYV